MQDISTNRAYFEFIYGDLTISWWRGGYYSWRRYTPGQYAQGYQVPDITDTTDGFRSYNLYTSKVSSFLQLDSIAGPVTS